jgi:hypothetical protein
MLRAWWQANVDARRSTSLLLSVAGLTVVGIATSASPVSLAFDNPPYGAGLVGAFLGAAIGGHFRHRVSDPERALLWALANGASVAAILIAAFVTLVVIRPTLRGIPGLGDAWGGVLVSGLLVAYVGAFLWERDARRRRFGGLALLAAWLIAVGIVARSSGDPWAALEAPVSLSGLGVLLLTALAFEASRRSSHQDAAEPDTWR